MDENRQNTAGGNLSATDNKLWLPPLSPRDQKKPTRLHSAGLLQRIYKRTGFAGKTLWDWLQLLGVLAIPLVVVGATLYFTQQQAALSDAASKQQHQNDIQLANDQQWETTLKTYLDDMGVLLLKPNDLLNSKPADAVRQVARERTLTTLRRLDASRNRIVLQFLQDAHLIGVENPIIDLRGADLSGDNLSNVNLRNVNLSRANRDSRNSTDANLSSADLSNANLSGADLSNANLSGADLSSAELYLADLSSANLINADLHGAHLGFANLSNADLSYARLGDADLSNAHLSNTSLGYADLSNAHLSNTSLGGADLSYADLLGADLSSTILGNICPKGGKIGCTNLKGARYNTKQINEKDAQGNLFITFPTQWPQGFDPQAARAICVDC